MECWLTNECSHKHCNDQNGCLILYKLNYLYDQAGININLRKNKPLYADADGTDSKEFQQINFNIKNKIVDFVNNGEQLFIHSSIAGNGKTSTALKLMQTYFKKIWLKSDLRCRGLFIHVPTFLIALKDNISVKNEYIQHIKENINECDLVIWDDIGTKSSTQFEAENLLSMIDSRINKGKSNIFTSNLNNKEMHDALGDRLASRICNLGYNIELHGGDKRGLE